MKRMTTISVDESILREVRLTAAETGREESEIIEAALHQYLNRNEVPTLDGLRLRRDELVQIAEKHGARNLRVFGSVARGDATAESDVDFLVELDPGRTLLDLSGLILDIQDALGREVNVVEITKPSRVADRIRREAIPL